VRYNNTEFSFYKELKFSAGYVITTSLPLYVVKENTIRVVAETLDGSTILEIAEDDGAGNLTANSGFAVSGDSINYDLGSIAFTVDSGLALTEEEYIVKIYYDTEVLDILPKKRNQILYLKRDETNVTAQYFNG